MDRGRVCFARLVVPIAFAIVATPASVCAQDEPARGTATIVGEVRSDAGKPLAKSFVSIAALTRGAVSDARGRFALADLPAGRARILVRAVGYTPLDTVVVLEDGQLVELSLRLKQVIVHLGESASDNAARPPAAGVDNVETGRVSLDTTLAFDYAGFGARLLTTAVRNAPDSNVVLSPLGAGQALGLAMGAARGSTALAISRELWLGELRPRLARRTQTYNRWLADRKDVRLSVANALWVDESDTLQPEFAASAREYFGASVREAPLRSKSTAKAMNAWADSATRGRIARVRDKPFDDSVRTVLANVASLQANWLTPFDKKLTRDVPFTTADGRRIKVAMMHRDARFGYRWEHGYQVARVPYRAGITAMYILLPDSGVSTLAVIDSLERYGWPIPNPGTESPRFLLALPRFRIHQQTDLEPLLTNIGVGIVFDANRANFGGLLLPNPDRPRAHIDVATQNVLVDVDELGSGATAVTAPNVDAVDVSRGPTPFEFIADRPFFFVIRDERTGTLLFAGYVARPRR
jgi:serpin B